jgi:hypothetical protein
MVQGSVVFAESPDGSARARPRRLGFARGSGRALPRPVAVVSEEQILALVAAADGLRRRQRQRYADGSTAAADGRLLRLDWAGRAGRLVLADRAAQGLTSTEVTAQPWRGRL